MPIRHTDFFADPTQNLRKDVNQFVQKLIDGAGAGQLPALYGPQLEAQAGRWLEFFAARATADQPAPTGLVLEIGCHKGDVLAQMAMDFPTLGFLGMDITFKRVVMTAEQATQQGLNNLASLLGNATEIRKLFPEDSLDGIVIFFPDPWDKKRSQVKKRLVSAAFVAVLKDLLKPGGFLWFKTDCEPYFQDVAAAAASANLRRGETSEGVPSRTYLSRFEAKFRQEGKPTHGAVWLK